MTCMTARVLRIYIYALAVHHFRITQAGMPRRYHLYTYVGSATRTLFRKFSQEFSRHAGRVPESHCRAASYIGTILSDSTGLAYLTG
ncbi:hypothetical protein EDB86DRAFT_2889669, partial [Lactarius hatsudake]